jgi:polar amino acid transport system permease protein
MHNLLSFSIQISYGLYTTVILTLTSFCIGILLGTSLAIARFTTIAKKPIDIFVMIIQSTPVILQLTLLYFSLPTIIGIKINIITAGIITFGINSSAYIAKIIQCGIESINQGQFEAAKSLEIPIWHTWKDIILPQVIKNIFPALINECILILKETSLISIIGGIDLMRMSQIIAAEHFIYFTPLCITGLYYLFLVNIIQYIGYQLQPREKQ